MKLFIFSALVALVSCTVSKPAPSYSVTIDHIQHNPGDSSEIWAKRRKANNQSGYVWYMAKVASVPDSLKIGRILVINVIPNNCTNCIVFNRMK